MLRFLLLPLLFLAALAAIYWWYRSPHGYFRTPLDRSLDLAANFGELREGHFHMGLDIRTGGREGLPVYAAADGYISHLSISEAGLGNALFITHPNGIVTVYGHLQQFADSLASIASRRQYAAQSWRQELDLAPNVFPVKKGDLIASSGNTGASRAPHLHFEMRDAVTGANINPQLKGLSTEDDVPPVISGLYWYDRRYSIYMTRAQKIPLVTRDGSYRTQQPLIRLSSPVVSLGITATDKSSSSSHISGIYSATLWLDDSLIHQFSLGGLSATDTRYINACIDYGKWLRSGIYVQHLSTLPGNHAPIFMAKRDGVIRLKDTLTHTIRVRVTDVQGNQSGITARIRYTPRSGSSSDDPLLYHTTAYSGGRPFSSGTVACQPGESWTIAGASFMARFSTAAFYDRLPFHWQELPDTNSHSVSALIFLHDATVPIHDHFLLKIKTTLPRNSPLRAHTVLQLISGDSQYISKGKWQDDWLGGSFNRLGIVRLLVDTVSPVISSFTAANTGYSVQCHDDLGPIATFRGEIDGHWVPFAQRGSVYSYTFDAMCGPGAHRLTITVSDVAGNTVRKEVSFVRG